MQARGQRDVCIRDILIDVAAQVSFRRTHARMKQLQRVDDEIEPGYTYMGYLFVLWSVA